MHIQPPYPIWLILAALGLMLAVIVFGYRRRARRLELTGKQVAQMIILRAFGLIILAFILLRPYVRIGEETEKRLRFFIFVDTSASFSIRDQRLPPAAGHDDNTQPVTRIDVASLSITRILTKPLSHIFDVKIVGFGSRLHRVENKNSSPHNNTLFAANDPVTDLSAPIRELADINDDGTPVGGAILFSDGRHTAGPIRKIQTALDRLSAATRIYTVLTGGNTFRDFALKDVRTSKTAALNTMVKVTGRLAQTGMAGQTATLAIYRYDRRGVLNKNNPIRRKTVHFDPADGKTARSKPFEFNFLPMVAGIRQYRLAVSAPDGVDEITTENNIVDFIVDARNRPLKVLYMEGSMYMRENDDPPIHIWEHQFLEQALSEGILDKDGNTLDIDVKTLFRDNTDGVATRAGVEWIREWEEDPDKGFPTSREKLYQYDVIICSDIDINFFTHDQLEWMRDLVKREGGGFVMIGGWTSFGPGGYDESILDAMLPVDMLGLQDEFIEEDNCLKWAVPKSALKHPIMILDKDPERNKAIWDAMPPFHGFNLVERAKPAATVLAYHPDIDRYGNVDGDPAPILVVQQYGMGRSMAFLTDTTAGWGRDFETNFGSIEGDNRYYRTFWRNAIRWLAEERLSRPSQKVLHKLDAGQAQTGEAFDIRVQVRNHDYRPARGAVVKTEITEPNGTKTPITLSAYPEAGPAMYHAPFVPATTGFYALRTEAWLNGDSLGTDTDGFFATASVAEFDDPRADPTLMNRIAQRTAGVMVPISRVGRLPDMIERDRLTHMRFRDKETWDNAVFYIALVALFCVEWFLRKKRALP